MGRVLLKFAMRYTLKKDEKLRHKSLVDGVFEKGDTLYDYPLRLSYRVLSDDELKGSFRNTVPEGIGEMQMLITVPKKKLRHAVDRVRMRRLIREAYRLNRLALKEMIRNEEGIGTLSMAFVYLHKEKTEYTSIETKMRKLLDAVKDKLGKEECESES